MTRRKKDEDETQSGATDTPTEASGAAAAATPAQVQWDLSQSLTRYANAANVTVIRDEVSLFLGIHNGGVPGQENITVAVSERVIIPPVVAKRLHALIGQRLAEYEEQFGNIDDQ